MKVKFYFTKIFTLFFLITIIFSTSVNASSKTKDQYLQAKSHAQRLMSEFDPKCKLKEPIELYNFQNSVQALLFPCEKSGYIIINLEDNSIVEFSPKSNNKYITNKNKKYFYNGALSYFEESNGQIIDSSTKNKVGSFESLKDTKYPVKPNKTIDSYSTLSSVPDKLQLTLKNPLPNFSKNDDGRCVTIATAMMLTYLADYRKDCEKYAPQYIHKNYTIDNQMKFSDELLYAITKSHQVPVDKYGRPGIDMALVPAGLDDYLSHTNGVSNPMKFNYYLGHLTLLKAIDIDESLSDDIPVVLGVTRHPSLGNHAVTAWGLYKNGTDHLFLVNDGHGDNSTYISFNYVTEYVARAASM